MKRLASAFYGRAGGYDAALDARDRAALAQVLARNVLGVEEAECAAPLADYVLAAEARLGASSLDDLLRTGPAFPEPGQAPSVSPAERIAT